MVYVNSVLVFRKGEFNIEPTDRVFDLCGFRIAAMSNAIVEYDDHSVRFLKNRYAIEDTKWDEISKAISLNESIRKKEEIMENVVLAIALIVIFAGIIYFIIKRP